jgi:hypothetical protein
MLYHETQPQFALAILDQGFAISHQPDYPVHAFFYAERFTNTTSVNKGAIVSLEFPEDLTPYAVEGTEAYEAHTPIAIPFEVVHKYRASFRVTYL